MTDNNTLDPDQVIENCLEGDQYAYTQLYEMFVAGLYRLCYGLVLNPLDAEDVVQESFVYAFKNLHRFDRSKASFKTWLYTIAVSRCRNTHRRKRLPQIEISQLFQFNLAAPRSETPEARLAHRTAEETLVKALAQLTAPLREAIVLRYGQGLTYREAAEVMDCPPKTAESRVRLAHQRLYDILEPAGKAILQELASF